MKDTVKLFNYNIDYRRKMVDNRLSKSKAIVSYVSNFHEERMLSYNLIFFFYNVCLFQLPLIIFIILFPRMIFKSIYLMMSIFIPNELSMRNKKMIDSGRTMNHFRSMIIDMLS